MRSRRSARLATKAGRRLDPRVRVALILVVAGALLAALGVALMPAQMGESGVVARQGPAVARYDEATDSTVAAFYCGHWRCAPAYVIAGDARADVAKERVYLRAHADDWRVVPIAPLETRDSPEPITEAYAGPFEATTPGPRILPLVVGPLVFATGVGFALPRQGRLAPAWTTLGGAAGVVAGVLGAGMGEGGLMVLLAAGVLGVGAVALLLSRRTRAAGVALALGAVVAAWLTVQASPWFPSPPAV